MDKILLLMQLPGFGIKKVKRFLLDNKLLLDDDDYFIYLVKKEVGGSIGKYIDNACRIKNDCNNLGIKIISCTNINIINYPPILYIKGNDKLLYEKKILGVIGSRDIDISSLTSEDEIINYIVNSGWTIISGYAKGCDMFAHKKTVEAGGQTIAVLPMGLNRDIASFIVESGGLLVSEYAPYLPITKYRCVERNRIISGYSNGIYVIKVDKGSGTLNTINYALQKNIPICYNKGFKGINSIRVKHVDNLEEIKLFIDAL